MADMARLIWNRETCLSLSSIRLSGTRQWLLSARMLLQWLLSGVAMFVSFGNVWSLLLLHGLRYSASGVKIILYLIQRKVCETESAWQAIWYRTRVEHVNNLNSKACRESIRFLFCGMLRKISYPKIGKYIAIVFCCIIKRWFHKTLCPMLHEKLVYLRKLWFCIDKNFNGISTFSPHCCCCI